MEECYFIAEACNFTKSNTRPRFLNCTNCAKSRNASTCNLLMVIRHSRHNVYEVSVFSFHSDSIFSLLFGDKSSNYIAIL